MELNRGNYDIYMAFPEIRDFPVYTNPNPNLAVLVRLFTMADYPPISHKFVYMAIWSMRSHMLNSDMKDYEPSIVFHIEDVLYETAKPIFDTAGIPAECIITFPTDLVTTSLTQNALHKAVAPFVDSQLEKFERIIVFDADSFSLANERSGAVPLMDISLNYCAPDTITLLRSWTKWDPERDEYTNWYDHGGIGKTRWLERTAAYCNTTPDHIERILYPLHPTVTPRPFHNGAYINFTTRLLKDNPELRQFIHKVSGEMGNEEIAMAIWAIRHFIRTGNHYPKGSLQDYMLEHDRFTLYWNLDTAWKELSKGNPTLVHLYGFDQISDYVYDWAKSICASEAESKQFGDRVIKDVNELRESQ